MRANVCAIHLFDLVWPLYYYLITNRFMKRQQFAPEQRAALNGLKCGNLEYL